MKNCGRSSSVEHQLPKLDRRVQFPSPAFIFLLFVSGCASAPYVKPATYQPVNVPGIYHRVERGETLWRISRSYGVDLDRIAAVNRITDSALIEVGQKILIPGILKEPDAPMKIPQGEDFIWPVKGRVEGRFGQSSGGVISRGIYIRPFSGRDIVASMSGRVVFANDNFAGLGRTVIIEHKDNFFTVYSFETDIIVRPGDTVKQGAVIARLNLSGDNRLFFQIRKGHLPKNPIFYLP